MSVAKTTKTIIPGPSATLVDNEINQVNLNINGGVNGSLPVYAVDAKGGRLTASMYNGRYLANSLIPVILTYPKVFNYFEKPSYWKNFLKWLFEVHAKTITGFDASLTVEYAEYDAGDNVNKYRQASKVTQAASNVATEVDELVDNPIEHFLDAYIRYGLGDPVRGVPLITRLLTEKEAKTYNQSEFTTFSGIFIEPDILLRKVVRAYYVFDMQPDGNPNLVGGKDQAKAKEVDTKTITWGGVSVYSTNTNVYAMAQHYINLLKLWEQDPETIMLPEGEVDTDLNSVNANTHYAGVDSNTD